MNRSRDFRLRRLLWTLLLSASLALIGVILVNWRGDGLDARSVSADPSAQSAPKSRPSAAQGAEIYTSKCAPCHGDQGKGDGPQAAQIQSQTGSPPANFTNATTWLGTTPANWYDVIVNGRMDRLMPPFNSLSEAERWNVLVYIWSLHVPQSEIDQGKKVYTDTCAGCHGTSGKGDGPKAPSSGMPDFTNLTAMAGKSQADLIQALANKPQGHDFSSLTADEQRAVSEYVRAFSYSYSAPPAAPQPADITVVGQVTNKTAGGKVPADLPVTIHVLNQVSQTLVLTQTVGPGGQYKFEKVHVNPGDFVATTAQYQTVGYVSPFEHFSGAITATLPITIYESTTDPRNLHVVNQHVVIGFDGGNAKVAEIYVFGNRGDRTYVGPSPGHPNSPTVVFKLPAGAQNLSFQNGGLGGRYVQTTDGFADTVPVEPGDNSLQTLFAYDMPYSGDLKWSIPVVYPTDQVNVLMQDQGVSLTSTRVTGGNPTAIQGANYRVYSGQNFAPGTAIDISLSGQPQTQTSASAGPATISGGSSTELVVGAVALALAVGGIGYWFGVRNRRQMDEEDLEDSEEDIEAVEGESIEGEDAVEEAPEPEKGQVVEDAELEAQREQLLQQIADLDDDYEAKRISEPAYRTRRVRLKDELLKLDQHD